MSKAIIVPPSSKLFAHQQLQRGAFRPKDQPLAAEFNDNQDPLSYRDSLPVPPIAQIKTGFAFLDTSMRLVYDKKDDTNSPLRGIRFNSHGIGFRIEKSNITGSPPFYETVVLISEGGAQVSYRMTPDDIVFALACMAQECDLANDAKLAELYELFTKRALTHVPLDKKTVSSFDAAQKETSFEFAKFDKTYSVKVPESGSIKFNVSGHDERNSLKWRSMTLAEINYAINKIVSDIPRNDFVTVAPAIQKMREHSWTLAAAAKAAANSGNGAAERKLNY